MLKIVVPALLALATLTPLAVARDLCPPACVPDAPPESVQCWVVVGTGAAGAVCWSDDAQIGPIATCQYCLVLYSVTCTAGTEEVRCWDNGGVS